MAFLSGGEGPGGSEPCPLPILPRNGLRGEPGPGFGPSWALSVPSFPLTVARGFPVASCPRDPRPLESTIVDATCWRFGKGIAGNSDRPASLSCCLAILDTSVGSRVQGPGLRGGPRITPQTPGDPHAPAKYALVAARPPANGSQ